MCGIGGLWYLWVGCRVKTSGFEIKLSNVFKDRKPLDRFDKTAETVGRKA